MVDIVGLFTGAKLVGLDVGSSALEAPKSSRRRGFVLNSFHQTPSRG